MTCSSCGAANEAGRKFCGECAAPLVLVCPSCRTGNPPTVKFCGECATRLALEGPTAGVTAPGFLAPATPTAERRLVSVLFADLVGFTSLAEGRDAEETRELLSRYFDLATEVVTRYGGTVEKFIGDAVMAVWGTPTVREDDAERAVRAALELVDAVRVVGPEISARVAVLTGEAAVTLGTTNQGMVAGDLVNTASRLQVAAAPGTVLVGEATQRAASRAIAFEPAGEQTLKGKAAPVPAWRALRVIADRGGRGRAETLEAPFVGRDDELRLLKDLFHATVREGRTRLVAVTGIAGIGKSRLAWEFEKYLDGIAGTVWWHRGRSPAYGSGVSFWALGEMVRGRAGLAEGDDERTSRERIGTLLDGLSLSDDDRRWIEPALLALLGVGSGIGPEQLFGAWRTFFERLAASAPVVLVFEDLQWADSGTLDFIDHLQEWSRTIPLYIVTLARPELLERRSDWGTGRRSFSSLYLEPLPEPAMRALLAGLVPGIPESAARQIVARAEGIPLYAVETVRMLVADGRLTATGDGTYAPAGKLAGVPVPETLTALIASRLDSLDATERSLILDAAVLGQSFTPAALAAISGTEPATLEPHLRALVRRELLVREADPRSPERGQYAFVQALIREVAYNTLAKRDRRTRHLAAARYLEALGSDELAGALAGHFLAARDNTPEGPERDALAAQARVALRGAADRAAGLADHDGALAFLEQALTATNAPADRAELFERAADEASLAGRHETAEGHARAALTLRREIGDRPAMARATTTLARVLIADYRQQAALVALEPAAGEFADLGMDPATIALDGQFARALMLCHELPRSVEVADRVLAAAERADLREIVADTLVTKGSALRMLGRTTEGVALLRAGIEVAEQNELTTTLLRGYTNLSGAEIDRDLRAALEICRAGLALARRLGRRSQAANLLVTAAFCAWHTGDWTWAVSELEAALDDDLQGVDRIGIVFEAIELRAARGEAVADLFAELTTLLEARQEGSDQAYLDWNTAEVAQADGRLAEARVALHRAGTTEPDAIDLAATWAARLALWMGDLEGARQDLALSEASPYRGSRIEADRLTARAGIAAIEGRAGDALPLYREALRAWRELGLPWDEALCGLDMAILCDADDPDVRAATTRSREILVGLGAKPFIERLDAAVAVTKDAPARAMTPT